MKKITFLMAFLALLSWQANAQQPAGNYGFTETTEAYTPVVGTVSTATGDDGSQNSITIPFTFKFEGVTYTTFSINTNGFIRLGAATAGTSWTNLLSNTAPQKPFLAPFWDDNNKGTGSIQYSVSGVSPNQILEIGWDNINIGGSGATSTTLFASFKIRLYETTDVIEFIYGPTMANAGALTASVGINGTATFLSVTPAASSITSNATANNTISATTDLVGKKFIFTPPAPPACLVPSALTATALTAISANLGWTENGSATTWNIEWGVTGFTPTGTPTISGTTTNPHVLGGLSASTTYQFYVQADCGGSGTSTWAGPFSFTTPCAAVVAPWNETFENAGLIPNCWRQGVANAEPWKFANSGAGNHIGNNGTITGTTTSGAYFAWVDDSSPDNVGTTLESPLIDVSGLTVPELSFFLISNNEGGLNVDFSVNVWDGATWNVGYYTHNTNTAGGAWEKIIVNLSSLSITGPIQLRFIVNEPNTGDYTDDVAIDDVDVHEAPACIAPTTLTATSITTSSANLGWTSAVGTWNIEWGVTGFTPTGTPTITGTTTNPHNLSGLSANTSYQFYVQSDCGGSGTSAWVGPFSFYTGYCLPSSSSTTTYVNNFSTTGGSANISNLLSGFTTGGYSDLTAQAVVSYAASSFNFTADIVGGTAGFSIWIDWNNDLVLDNATEKVFNTTTYGNGPFTGTINIPGGATLGDYRMRITTDWNAANPSNPCAAASTAEFEDYTVTVGTPPSCIAPTTLTATSITTSSANLGWTSAVGTWNIEWGVTGFTPTGTPTITGTTTNPHSLGGLSANTSYQFYVQADCGGSGTSTWAGPFSFTTPCGVIAVPFTEGFEAASTSLSCWSQIQEVGTSNWTYATGAGGGAITTAQTGTRNARFVSMTGTNSPITKLVSPTFDLTTLTTPELSFYYGQEFWSPDQNRLKVYYRVSSIDPWVEILHDSTNVATWTKKTLVLPNPSATYQVAFEGINNYGYANVIDEVEIKEALIPCSIPSNLTAFNITQTSAMLDWTENGTATEWNIEWGFQGFTLGTGTPEHVTAKPYLLNGLMPSTSYDYYVQADCGTDSSAWVGPYTFMTPPCMPIGLELGADTTLCSGQSLTLNAPTAGPYGWTWSTTESTPSITVDTASLGGNGTYNITINMIDFSTTCMYNDNINVTFTVCTGVNENAIAPSFTVYPNPTTGLFTVTTTQVEKATIEVINLQGKVVYKNIINSNNQVIDLRENAKGVYFVNITSTNGVDVLKIIVQ